MVPFDSFANKNWPINLSLVFSLSALILTGCSKKPVEFADMVIQGGTIYTVEKNRPIVEAVAVKKGLILYSGIAEGVKKLIGPDTYVLDLEGKTVIPGFIEGHGHFMNLGINQSILQLSSTQNLPDMAALLKERAGEADSGEWIQGRGWHQSKWTSDKKGWVKGFPTHQKLTEVSPNHPAMLLHASGHTLIANKAAMDLAGIDRNTKSPPGGEIIRDAKGDATGMFVENAQNLIKDKIPPPTAEQRRVYVKNAFKEILTNGITSFTDAGLELDDIELLKNFYQELGIPARLWIMVRYSESLNVDSLFRDGPIKEGDGEYLTIGGMKIWSDGALGSRGAWLTREYSDQHGHFGHETVPMKTVFEMAQKALKLKFQLCVHAIGDRANKEVLDKMQLAFKEMPEMPDHRFRIEHAQHIREEDIPRFAQLGVLPSMQGIHFSSDIPWAIHRLGEKRIAEGAYVWRKLLDAGSRIINGTDVPVESISPIENFYSLVSRKTLKGESESWFHPEQKMTRAEALKSYTLDAAYGIFQDKVKGSIEVGKMADFTVLSQDIMTVPEEEILNTMVMQTIVAGAIQYQRE